MITKLYSHTLIGFLAAFYLVVGVGRTQAANPEWQWDSSRDFTLEHESDGVADTKEQLPQNISRRELVLFLTIMAGSAAWLAWNGKQNPNLRRINLETE